MPGFSLPSGFFSFSTEFHWAPQPAAPPLYLTPSAPITAGKRWGAARYTLPADPLVQPDLTSSWPHSCGVCKSWPRDKEVSDVIPRREAGELGVLDLFRLLGYNCSL
jgi:hypothetical protein